MMLSDACTSGLSREQRAWKTKIGTEVAQVTCDSDTTFMVKRSKGQRSRSPGRFTRRGVYTPGTCSGDHGNAFTVGTYCYVAARRGRLGGARRFGARRGM